MKTKGERQSTNVEVAGKDYMSESSDPNWPTVKGPRDKAVGVGHQKVKALKSEALRSPTPMKEQTGTYQTDINNDYYANSPEGIATRNKRATQLQETNKPTQLTDCVYPKEMKTK